MGIAVIEKFSADEGKKGDAQGNEKNQGGFLQHIRRQGTVKRVEDHTRERDFQHQISQFSSIIFFMRQYIPTAR